MKLRGCLVLGVVIGMLGCGAKKDGASKDPGWRRAPDFSLFDENTNSASYGHTASPRDFRGEVTAWYFANST